MSCWLLIYRQFSHGAGCRFMKATRKEASLNGWFEESVQLNILSPHGSIIDIDIFGQDGQMHQVVDWLFHESPQVRCTIYIDAFKQTKSYFICLVSWFEHFCTCSPFQITSWWDRLGMGTWITPGGEDLRRWPWTGSRWWWSWHRDGLWWAGCWWR